MEMEEELGPPAVSGGRSGPWMLWRRPGTGLPTLLVHAHDNGEMSLELLPSDADADAVGRARSRAAGTPPSQPGTPIEATGYVHHTDAASPARLMWSGWDFSRTIWQRRFHTPSAIAHTLRQSPACSSKSCGI
ncbi:hypothetical protein ACIQVA_31180 [Streptomyces microflavus]|uniref:hypothetical protein n=1 Tax=Streptomyces microflavus TaxID=1919 RepID=UPI0038052A1B